MNIQIDETLSVWLLIWLIGIPLALMVLVAVLHHKAYPNWLEGVTLNTVTIWATAFGGALIWPAVLLLWLLDWAWKLFLMAWRRY